MLSRSKLVCGLSAATLIIEVCSTSASADPARTSHPPAKAAAAVPVLVPEGTIQLFQSPRRVMVMMRIGEDELLPMVFDTGSDGHTFDTLIVRRHHLRQAGTTIVRDGTSGIEQTSPIYGLPQVTLGGLAVGSIEGVGEPYDRSDAMGIISSEMFTGRLVSVELAQNRARILPLNATTLPPGPATPHNAGLPATPIHMPDGSTIIGELDTGYNSALSLPTAMMGRVSLMSPPRVIGRYRSTRAEGEVWGGELRGDVTIGPVVLHNPLIAFLGDRANIGLPVIRQLTLVIDPAAKRSWILPPVTKAAH